MSLGEFVNDLFIEMNKNGIMIPSNGKKWGNFLYELKKEDFQKPDYISNLHFNWDAEYPICPDFNQIYSAIRSFHGCPTRTDLKLDGEMIKTQTVDENYLSHALLKAKEYFMHEN